MYERIDLILPAKRDEMIENLRTRTGLFVTGVQVDAIDFLQETAKIRVFYQDDPDGAGAGSSGVPGKRQPDEGAVTPAHET